MKINISFSSQSGGNVSVNAGAAAACREQRTLHVPHRANTALGVETHNGAVTARQSARKDVEIVAELRLETDERLKATEVVAERDKSGALAVRVKWPAGGPRGSEGCDLEVLTPGACGVALSTANGAIVMQGLAGPAQLRTSNGQISVASHDGPATAEASNGGIKLDGINGEVRVASCNGAVDVSLAPAAAGPVNIRTSNGPVRLNVGAGFAGTLDMSTVNGSIDVGPQPRAWAQTGGFGPAVARVQVGQGGAASSIQTTNGGIQVRVGA